MKGGSVVAVSALCLIAGLAIGYRAAIVGKIAEKINDEDVTDEESLSELEKLDGIE